MRDLKKILYLWLEKMYLRPCFSKTITKNIVQDTDAGVDC